MKSELIEPFQVCNVLKHGLLISSVKVCRDYHIWKHVQIDRSLTRKRKDIDIAENE